jgi:hypothetical protein
VTTTASTGGLWDCSMYVHGAPHVPGYHTGDVIGLLVDRTNGKLVFYRNGVAVGSTTRETSEQRTSSPRRGLGRGLFSGHFRTFSELPNASWAAWANIDNMGVVAVLGARCAAKFQVLLYFVHFSVLLPQLVASSIALLLSGCLARRRWV